MAMNVHHRARQPPRHRWRRRGLPLVRDEFRLSQEECRHAQEMTGTEVRLSGKGADNSDEALTLSILATCAVTDKAFSRAVALCDDLLVHVYEEAAE